MNTSTRIFWQREWKERYRLYAKNRVGEAMKTGLNSNKTYMSKIKNIDLIKPLLTENQFQALETGAVMHQRYSRIEFKILEIKENEITIRVTQGESPSENHLSPNELAKRGKDFFQQLLPDKIIHVRSLPFHVAKVNEVNIGWIQSRMTSKGMTRKSLVEETGIEKERIQSWIYGLQPMSQEVKAMFWYMLR